MLTEPMHVFAAIATVGVVVYAATGIPALRRVFEFVPPVVWLYFTPMLLSAVGLLPRSSQVYDWMARNLLPFSLFLITITISLPALARMGRMAAIMILCGTFGTTLGAVVALAACRAILPLDAWQSLSMLTASWIGGSANMLAMHQSLEADASLLGPIVVVDTVIGYGWLGVVIALSSYQKRFDRWLRADRTTLDAVSAELIKSTRERRPVTAKHLIMAVGGAFGVSVLARALADSLPSLGDPVIISASTWTVIFVVSLGLALSFTRLRQIESHGGSELGYAGLFLLFASVGAQANFAAIFEAPQFIIAGAIMMAVHIAVLLGAARLIRAPFFFVATGSMANIGGAVSAPIAAAAYAPPLAPVGALMGIAGYVIGIYVPLALAPLLAKIGGL